ncbi:MAG: response regulator [Nitrospirales bacterium]
MGSAAKILLADDEQTFLYSTADLLRDQGYECDCAMDAVEANALLQRAEYDLLISDINMPGNGQLEFLNAVHGEQQGLPVIVITGYPSVETAVHSFRLSAVDYLQKPIDIDELLGLIDPAVQKGQLARRVRKTKEEMQGLVGILETLENFGATGRTGSGPDDGSFALSAYLDQAVSHLATVSVGLKTTIDTIKNCGVGEETELNIGGVCPRCQSYREVLFHTIQVLMRTKDTFKSKPLGELRRQVEIVLEDPQTLMKKA